MRPAWLPATNYVPRAKTKYNQSAHAEFEYDGCFLGWRRKVRSTKPAQALPTAMETAWPSVHLAIPDKLGGERHIYSVPEHWSSHNAAYYLRCVGVP
eukprot:6946026-Prymnesium_polylepis.1